MTFLIAHVAWKLKFGGKGRRNRRIRYLEVVANGLKNTYIYIILYRITFFLLISLKKKKKKSISV